VRWQARLSDVRVPPDLHVAEFTAADLDDAVALFRLSFRREAPPERVRRGLAYRYVDNPWSGHPATAPLLARQGGPGGPLVGFFGCLPAPVRFRGRSLVAGFPVDFFIHPGWQPRRLGLLLLRALLARTRDVIFTSSAGPATQALLRYYGVIPLPGFASRWVLPVTPATPAVGRAPSGWRGLLGRLGRDTGPAGRGGRRSAPGTAALTLAPLSRVSDLMVDQAARATGDATYTVDRTRAYLEWRFGPPVRAAAPECEVLALLEGDEQVGWLVLARRAECLEILDWFVPAEHWEGTLGLAIERARAAGLPAVSGRGMQSGLRELALGLGAVEQPDLMLYWTWAPDPAVYEGMDWGRAYLSATDGDLTLPWNLDPER
jgi:GNAT superfamily N-acetyltransferase